MQREVKSERSRRAVLDAALQLFSRQGYRATTMRDIAEQAGVSTGNVYHHFPDKEGIFQELIGEYFAITESEKFPFTRALNSAAQFPDNIELLGFAVRESIRKFKPYQALIYVDVIEFGGTHIRHFYEEMGARFTRFFEEQGRLEDIRRRLRPSVTPTSAILLTTRLFFNYFTLEILFGVEQPFGRGANESIEEIAEIIRHGICAPDVMLG